MSPLRSLLQKCFRAVFCAAMAAALLAAPAALAQTAGENSAVQAETVDNGVLWTVDVAGISAGLFKLVGTMLIVGFAFWFVRRYDKPIRKFLENVREIRGGPFSATTLSSDSTSPEDMTDVPTSESKSEMEKADEEKLSPEQQFQLGVRYAREGRQDKAVELYRRAAERGYARAQNDLGARYAKGRGVPEDQEEAVKWFRLAAEQGYARARNNLGVRYARGRGVPKNQGEAAKWYLRAAEQGLPTAQDNYGDMCAMNALVWYTLAADNEHPAAIVMRDKIRQVLSEDGLRKAEEEIARLRSEMAKGRG